MNISSVTAIIIFPKLSIIIFSVSMLGRNWLVQVSTLILLSILSSINFNTLIVEKQSEASSVSKKSSSI